MNDILKPELEITLDETTPTTLSVPAGETRRSRLARVRLACQVRIDKDIPTNEGLRLSFELAADDGEERQVLAPFVWGEINPNGGLLAQRWVQFHSNTPARTVNVERIGWVDQFLLDEDPPSEIVGRPWGTFNLRQGDEITAIFTLTRQIWPGRPLGFVEDTAEASIAIRI